MLILGIVFTVVFIAIVPLFSNTVSSIHYTRVTVMVFLLCLFIGTFPNLDLVDLYHSLFNYTYFSIIIDSLLYIVAALVLVCFSPVFDSNHPIGVSEAIGPAKLQGFNKVNAPAIVIKSEYSLILIFSILGASIMISANDLISMYVALELQSFGLYLLACLRTDQTGSTHASLKYFLLGAISSAFILLGISIIYQEVGSTSFQNINSFIWSIGDRSSSILDIVSFQGVYGGNSMMGLGLISMLCGFIFKISAAPFHSWFSDVIQGVPTYTGIIIINLPKISIFTFLFNMLALSGLLQTTWTASEWIIDVKITSISTAGEIFLVITTLFSLVLGTVAGLVQTKLKRLLAFSTISHVGFIIIGLTTGSEVSLSAIVFYLIQYTFTVVLTFLALVAYENSYLSAVQENNRSNSLRAFEVNYIVDLQGSGRYDKLLTFTFVLCLFSIAGIPPITGFYAKLGVLNSSIIDDISFVFITAIICSVISAAYYLKVIKILIFDSEASVTKTPKLRAETTSSMITGYVKSKSEMINPVHSYTIAVLTAFICLFILDPRLIINCTELVALSLYLL